MQAGLDAIAAQAAVGERRADAVFGEPVGEEAQLEQLGQDGRRLQPVALELDDDKLPHRAVDTCREIVKLQIGVDSEALGLSLIDEGDTVEVVLELWGEPLRIVAQMSADKLVVVVQPEGRGYASMRVEALGRGALLLRAPVIVLRLHLEEVQPYMQIGAHADLLAHEMTSLVAVIHRTVLRVVVERIIWCDDLTVDLLDVILVAGQREQLPKYRHRSHELRVDAVHQTDVSHLVEGDGLVLSQYLCHTFDFLAAKLGIRTISAKKIQ